MKYIIYTWLGLSFVFAGLVTHISVSAVGVCLYMYGAYLYRQRIDKALDKYMEE